MWLHAAVLLRAGIYGSMEACHVERCGSQKVAVRCCALKSRYTRQVAVWTGTSTLAALLLLLLLLPHWQQQQQAGPECMEDKGAVA